MNSWYEKNKKNKQMKWKKRISFYCICNVVLCNLCDVSTVANKAWYALCTLYKSFPWKCFKTALKRMHIIAYEAFQMISYIHLLSPLLHPHFYTDYSTCVFRLFFRALSPYFVGRCIPWGTHISLPSIFHFFRGSRKWKKQRIFMYLKTFWFSSRKTDVWCVWVRNVRRAVSDNTLPLLYVQMEWQRQRVHLYHPEHAVSGSFFR